MQFSLSIIEFMYNQSWTPLLKNLFAGCLVLQTLEDEPKSTQKERQVDHGYTFAVWCSRTELYHVAFKDLSSATGLLCLANWTIGQQPQKTGLEYMTQVGLAKSSCNA